MMMLTTILLAMMIGLCKADDAATAKVVIDESVPIERVQYYTLGGNATVVLEGMCGKIEDVLKSGSLMYVADVLELIHGDPSSDDCRIQTKATETMDQETEREKIEAFMSIGPAHVRQLRRTNEVCFVVFQSICTVTGGNIDHSLTTWNPSNSGWVVSESYSGGGGNYQATATDGTLSGTHWRVKGQSICKPASGETATNTMYYQDFSPSNTDCESTITVSGSSSQWYGVRHTEYCTCYDR